ncbi:hypothetical protein KRX57_06135 [Weeksellaceae bacterium TAE3-ERU29]|nr:hypothetical protein [Weeksellaceae bacterium TAE3-ERU29]
MITEEQNKQVIDFLLSKELPIDILSELHDHILSQIHEYQIQGMSFDEAFEKSKLTWKEDLEKHLDIYFGFNESKLVKKIYWSKMLPIYKKSLLVSLPFSFLILGLLQLQPYENDNILIIIFSFYLIIFFTIIYHRFFKYKKYYLKIKKYEYNKLSVYASPIYNGLSGAGLILSLLIPINTDYIELDGFSDVISFGVKVLIFTYLNTLILNSFYAQSKFIKAIDEKVKPYFPYLKANRFYK